MSNISLERKETVESVSMLVHGLAEMRKPRFCGDIVMDFHSKSNSTSVELINIASTLYFDDVFVSDWSFPYSLKLERSGFFECFGSSFFKRFTAGYGGIFEKFRHFGYFDQEFHWIIIAKDVVIVTSLR